MKHKSITDSKPHLQGSRLPSEPAYKQKNLLPNLGSVKDMHLPVKDYDDNSSKRLMANKSNKVTLTVEDQSSAKPF